MNHNNAPRSVVSETTRRQPWQEPQIVYDAALESSAQDGPPGAPKGPGVLGPLGTSGGTGTCT